MCSNTGVETQGWAERLCRATYDAAWALAAALVRPMAALGGNRWRNKLGMYPAAANKPHCWIHACSVGEVRVARSCIEALRLRRPDLSFTLSAITPEGFVAAKAAIRDARDRVVLFPFDARSAMRRAFRALDPDFVILTEVELWPNHLREAQARGTPAFVINGRLTEADERNYRRAGTFMRNVFAIPELVCARGAAEAGRFTRLGARDVVITGDMKYDTVSGADAGAHPRSGALLLGASTHEGEEAILLETAKRLRRSFPDLRVALAPRHTRRAAGIARLAEREGFRVALASSGDADCEVVVIDEVGQLAMWYGKATLCFVGKSLTAHGGQNFLEAADAGCPVVTGPNLENFAEAAALFREAGAMVQVRGAREVESEIARLMSDNNARDNLKSAAEKVLAQNRGASSRVAELVLGRLRDRI